MPAGCMHARFHSGPSPIRQPERRPQAGPSSTDTSRTNTDERQICHQKNRRHARSIAFPIQARPTSSPKGQNEQRSHRQTKRQHDHTPGSQSTLDHVHFLLTRGSDRRIDRVPAAALRSRSRSKHCAALTTCIRPPLLCVAMPCHVMHATIFQKQASADADLSPTTCLTRPCLSMRGSPADSTLYPGRWPAHAYSKATATSGRVRVLHMNHTITRQATKTMMMMMITTMRHETSIEPWIFCSIRMRRQRTAHHFNFSIRSTTASTAAFM